MSMRHRQNFPQKVLFAQIKTKKTNKQELRSLKFTDGFKVLRSFGGKKKIKILDQIRKLKI